MAYTYIVLDGLKYEVVDGGADGGAWGHTGPVRRTFGGTYKSIGADAREWEYEIFLKVAADSGYGSYSTLEVAANNMTAAGQTHTLTDHFGANVGNVFFQSVEKPKRVSVEVDGAAALYKTKIRMVKQ